MVAGKTDVGDSQGLAATLAIPRPLSRILLIFLCLGIAQAGWVFLDSKLLAFASGQAVAICTMCLAAVWSFREKASDILSSDDLSSEDLIMVLKATRQLGTQSIKRAVWVGVCVLWAGGAAASLQLSGFIMQWMVLLGGAGVAEALYALWLTSHLSAEVKNWRDQKNIEIREANELRQHVERVQNSVALREWAAQGEDSAKTISGELKPLH
jgi:hypothetical protein